MEINRKFIYRIIQLFCVVILGIIFFNIYHLTTMIQSTGRVINYSGLISSSSQRLVKLEISGTHRDDLILYLDGVIQELQTGSGQNELDKLNDGPYLEKLAELSTNWADLKNEIINYRMNPKKEATLIKVSETYVDKSNNVVVSAEDILNEKAQVLNILVILMIVFLSLLIFITFQEEITEILPARKKKELIVGEYLDELTGLPGRTICEEKIRAPMDIKERPYSLVMFDLNNLKFANDTFGHDEGDRLIKDFADILKHLTNDQVFIGRYGGDEFIMIVKGYAEEKINQILNEIMLQTLVYNDKSANLKIHYAVGCVHDGNSLQEMLEKADEKMCANKIELKAEQKDI